MKKPSKSYALNRYALDYIEKDIKKFQKYERHFASEFRLYRDKVKKLRAEGPSPVYGGQEKFKKELDYNKRQMHLACTWAVRCMLAIYAIQEDSVLKRTFPQEKRGSPHLGK